MGGLCLDTFLEAGLGWTGLRDDDIYVCCTMCRAFVLIFSGMCECSAM